VTNDAEGGDDMAQRVLEEVPGREAPPTSRRFDAIDLDDPELLLALAERLLAFTS
jgi:hypothetical protein